jgi:alpha-amylase
VSLPEIDYNNQTNVEQCSLGNTDVTLQDLNTEDTNVIAVFNSWIKGLISDYGFEAIRIDTVKHVRKVSLGRAWLGSCAPCC